MDIQFDISFFKDLEIPYRLSSYDAQKFNDQVPTLAINILSASTFKNDIGLVLEQYQRLQIPVYVILSDHLQAPSYVRAPMLKIYYLEGKQYRIAEIREICCKEGEPVDTSKLIDILPDTLPFKFGIMERKEKYLKETITPLYFLVLVDRETGEILPTSREIEKRCADEAEKKAELLQKQLDELKKGS